MPVIVGAPGDGVGVGGAGGGFTYAPSRAREGAGRSEKREKGLTFEPRFFQTARVLILIICGRRHRCSNCR